MPLSSHVTGGRRPAARYVRASQQGGKEHPSQPAIALGTLWVQTLRPHPHPTSQGHQSPVAATGQGALGITLLPVTGRIVERLLIPRRAASASSIGFC